MELYNFIGGTFVPSENGNFFSKLSPFDGKEMARVAQSDAMDFIKALQATKKALPALRDLSKEQRAEFLIRIADFLEGKSVDIAYGEALHQGLSQKFVLENSILPSVALLRATAQSLLSYSDSSSYPQPSGIVGIITPWCLSLKLVVERLAPAFAAGNGVLIKVSELSPITAQYLGDALVAAQIPLGAVNILQGNHEVASLLAGHPSIQAVTAVGKNTTLESIAKSGLPQFKKLQLSGGVKNPVIVLGDTDYKSLMPKILESFLLGQGQMCWNTSRLFVLESFAADFLSAAQEYLSSLKPLQDPQGYEVWTPLISEDALSSIHNKIQSGVSEHGKVLFGGTRLEGTGYFYKPTVMLDLPNCSVLQQDELQGPLLLVTPVKYQHEILKWANTSYLGHSAVVWGPEEKMAKITGPLEFCQIWKNSWNPGAVAPIFGWKQSSFGNPDMSWSGGFYSDVKKLAGTP